MTNWVPKRNKVEEKKRTLCLGVEPSFRATIEMTGACTNRYTSRELKIDFTLRLSREPALVIHAENTTSRISTCHLLFLFLVLSLFVGCTALGGPGVAGGVFSKETGASFLARVDALGLACVCIKPKRRDPTAPESRTKSQRGILIVRV